MSARQGHAKATRRGLAVAGFVLSLAAALIAVGFFVLAILVLSHAHST